MSGGRLGPGDCLLEGRLRCGEFVKFHAKAQRAQRKTMEGGLRMWGLGIIGEFGLEEGDEVGAIDGGPGGDGFGDELALGVGVGFDMSEAAQCSAG